MKNIYVRKQLRRLYQNCNCQHQGSKKQKKKKSTKFYQYFDWSEPLSKAPSHRLLAMLRATKVL
jgi:uncharacterized protein